MVDVRLSLRASPLAVREALLALRTNLMRLSVPVADVDSVELVLAEVLNNILEHALAGRDHGEISIHLETTPRGVAVEVVDDGKPMPGGQLPAGTCPDAAVGLEDLPEGGFGWFIIRSLTTNLDYRRELGLNRLRFDVTGSSANTGESAR